MPDLQIKMSEVKTASDPGLTLTIPNIVSGIGIVMYDPVKKIGGAAHPIIPNGNPSDPNPQKYVDLCIAFLAKDLESKGVSRGTLFVKLAGGAKILNCVGIPMGEKNLKSAREALAKEKLSVKGLDIGGSIKRTLMLNLANGEVTVERFNEGTKKI